MLLGPCGHGLQPDAEKTRTWAIHADTAGLTGLSHILPTCPGSHADMHIRQGGHLSTDPALLPDQQLHPQNPPLSSGSEAAHPMGPRDMATKKSGLQTIHKVPDVPT